MEKEELLRAYEMMFLIRNLELELVKHYYDNRIMSFVHYSVGQECPPVSLYNNIDEHSVTWGGHRSHALFLASGADPGLMVAEMLGKKAGAAGGFGGSMHLQSQENRFKGSTPILGPVISLGIGAALAKKIKKEPGISVSLAGDGCSETSHFYEGLNFATLYNLPYILLIENNLFSVNSPLSSRRSPNRSNKKIAEGLGAVYLPANGNDYLEASPVVKEAVSIAKTGRPVVLEMEVYRSLAHSAPIYEERFRGIDTKEEREKKDSVVNLKKYLEGIGENLEEIENQVKVKIAAAMEFGISAI